MHDTVNNVLILLVPLTPPSYHEFLQPPPEQIVRRQVGSDGVCSGHVRSDVTDTVTAAHDVTDTVITAHDVTVTSDVRSHGPPDHLGGGAL